MYRTRPRRPFDPPAPADQNLAEALEAREALRLALLLRCNDGLEDRSPVASSLPLALVL